MPRVSAYLISYNRRVFDRVTALSERRSELAQQLISMQENTLPLDFARIARRVRPDPDGRRNHAAARRQARRAGSGALRDDLREVHEIVQAALEKVRTLSQALHPVMLEEAGFESALDTYIPLFERRTGIAVRYTKEGRTLRPSTANRPSICIACCRRR